MNAPCRTNRCRGTLRTHRLVSYVNVEGCVQLHAVYACNSCGFRQIRPLQPERCRCQGQPYVSAVSPSPSPRPDPDGKLRFRPRVQPRAATVRRHMEEKAKRRDKNLS